MEAHFLNLQYLLEIVIVLLGLWNWAFGIVPLDQRQEMRVVQEKEMFLWVSVSQ